MNFELAKRAADEDARSLANGAATCPIQKTGLIVLVYGGDRDDALPGVSVTVNGKLVVTDPSGLARFIPIAAGDHTVHADRPEGSPELIAPDDEHTTVTLGQCPICPLHMPTGVIPEITILWAHDDHAVEGVEIEIEKSGAPKRTTSDVGIATWVQRVRPYRYDIKTVFPDGAAYLLFDGVPAVNWVDLSTGPRHTLKIKRNLVTFRVQKQVGAAVEELADARVKLKDPEKELATALKVGQAIAEFAIPIVKPDQKKTCEVVSLTPDTTDAVYEVVEVIST
jgi:hypothetical protein